MSTSTAACWRSPSAASASSKSNTAKKDAASLKLRTSYLNCVNCSNSSAPKSRFSKTFLSATSGACRIFSWRKASAAKRRSNSLINSNDSEQTREAQQAELTNRFREQDERLQGSLAQFATWSDTHREMRQLIADFERIGEGLERRINELAEIQRLSEERFRNEWNDWGSTEQQRWKQFTLSTDEIWRNHDREFERFVQRINALDARFPPLIEGLKNLWQLERKRARLYSDSYQQMLAEHDQEAIPRSVSPNSGR